MGRSIAGVDACPSGMTCYDREQPEHDATVDSFYMDKYEVTVGRFRRFVEQYDGWTKPSAGSGAHPKIAGSGWQDSWNSELPANQSALEASLKCQQSYNKWVWTDSKGLHEQHAINCVTWYEALAFCIWDGGRLPIEAEWEYAAAGGDENRLYPWGQSAPDGSKANYGGSDNSPFVPVGSKPAGAGRWGQLDLAGGEEEWVFDGYADSWYGSPVGNPCNNCARVQADTTRIARGSQWMVKKATFLRSAFRSGSGPTVAQISCGFRCVRASN